MNILESLELLLCGFIFLALTALALAGLLVREIARQRAYAKRVARLPAVALGQSARDAEAAVAWKREPAPPVSRSARWRAVFPAKRRVLSEQAGSVEYVVLREARKTGAALPLASARTCEETRIERTLPVGDDNEPQMLYR